MVNTILLGEGDLAVGSINGTGGGKHKVAQVCSPCARFHQIDEPDEITVHVGERILQEVPYAGLGRQIDNHFRFEIRNQTAEVSPIGEVHPLKPTPSLLRTLTPTPLFQFPVT